MAETYYSRTKARQLAYQKKNWLKHNKATREHWRRKQEKINRLKMVPCFDCQIQYSPWVMHFDHRIPKEKSFTIANRIGNSSTILKKEIEKCDVVCANCHAERTHKQIADGLITFRHRGI